MGQLVKTNPIVRKKRLPDQTGGDGGGPTVKEELSGGGNPTDR